MSEELENLRKKIDKIDLKILQKLAERFSLISKITEYKVKNSLPIFVAKREKEILRVRKILAKKLNLDELMIERIFRLILEESRFKQKNGCQSRPQKSGKSDNSKSR